MNLLLISNIAPHYRAPIYKLIDKEFNCDFVFGDKVDNIKKMDYTQLNHQVTEVHNVFLKHCYYQKGVPSFINKDYDTYLIIGDVRCISTWLFLFSSIFYPRKRIYFWSHGSTGKENWVKRVINRVFFSFCDGAFLYNETGRDLMIKQGYPQKKLVTIYNSLDYDIQLTIRNELEPSSLYQEHFGNERKNIIFIGRLTKVKKFDILLDAISHLKRQNVFLNLIFVGDGTERSYMESRVNELGLREQVWFYGACYDEKTNADLIYNADLCVSPGNIGLTAMHVLMFGCPAITNDDFKHQMPEFEAIKPHITGAFFHADDSVSLSEVIKKWLDEHDEEREKIRNACYKEIDEKWNPHNQIAIFKQVLEEQE